MAFYPSPPRRVRNMHSAYDHPEVINSHLAKEAGHNFHLATTFSSLRLSPFGIIPKCSQQNKWHLIIDLSLPEGHTVNDSFNPMHYSIKYGSVDNAVNNIQQLLAKLDLRDAYWIIPVHPDDHPLLGMQWRDSIYTDTALPFSPNQPKKYFRSH